MIPPATIVGDVVWRPDRSEEGVEGDALIAALVQVARISS
jgi:hypothetical protein